MIPNVTSESPQSGHFSGRTAGTTWLVSRQGSFHLCLATLCCLLAACLWGLQVPFVFPLDDAYITLQNAGVLTSSRVDHYEVDPLVGATSLVHLAAIAALTPLLGAVPAGFAVSMLAAAAYLQGIAALAFRNGASRATACLALAVGLGTGYTAYHLLNGLETGLALAGVIWALVLASSPCPSRFLPILCGLLPFVRPELGALSLPLLARHMLMRRASATGSEAWRLIAGDAALAMAAALPWLLWSWAATGSIVPGTAAAKQAFFAEAVLPPSEKAFMAAWALLAAGIGPVLAALIFLRADGLAWALWIFVACFVAAFAISFPGGLQHNHFRYVYITLPMAIFAWFHLRNQGREDLFRILLGVALAWCAYSVSLSLRTYLDTRAWMIEEQVSLAAWTTANLPTDAKVLVHDAGYIAFSTELRLVDLVGLKTPDSIAAHRRWTEPTGGRARNHAVHSIAIRHGVTHAIILKDKEGFWASLADDLRRTGWTLVTLRKPVGSVGYEVFKLSPPA